MMHTSSPAFADGEIIPRRHTADDADLSPPLVWTGLPDETQSLTLIVDDPDATNRTFVHWLLWDIAPSPTRLEQAVHRARYLQGGMRQGRNDFGSIGWGGPMPPPGPAHRYRFTLFALSESPQLRAGANVHALRAHMRPFVLDSAQFLGIFAAG